MRANQCEDNGKDLPRGNENAETGRRHEEAMGIVLQNPESDCARLLMSNLPGFSNGWAGLPEVVVKRHPDGERGKVDILFCATALSSDESDVMEASVGLSLKHAKGSGSSNQTLRIWAGELLSKEEAEGPVGRALSLLCGSLSKDGPRLPSESILPAGALGRDGIPLKAWLGENAKRLLGMALCGNGEHPATHVWVTHSGIDGKSDLHIMVPVESIIDETLREMTNECRACSPGSKGVWPQASENDASFSFGSMVSLKRKAGDCGLAEGDQLQFTIKPPRLLEAVMEGRIKGALAIRQPATDDGRLLLLHMDEISESDALRGFGLLVSNAAIGRTWKKLLSDGWAKPERPGP